MLSSLVKTLRPLAQISPVLLNREAVLHQQLRTTYILKRKYPAPLVKKGFPVKRLRSKYYIYELERNTATEKKPDIDLILTNYVEGLGNTGDKVSVPPTYGYNKLLLPGLAVYASPENIEKYRDYKGSENEVKHSSAYSQATAKHFSRILLSVVMNKDNPWTLQPWHVRASFRKCGYIVPEEAITLPSKPIKGPDMNLQDKEFFVTVTINNLEKVDVRCRIHHWSTDISERIPHVNEFWQDSPGAVFEEETSILQSTPRKGAVTEVKTN